MKATPGPMVSGRNFLPKAPLLWTKRIPEVCVTSRNRIAEVSVVAPFPVCWTTSVANARARIIESERFTIPPGFSRGLRRAHRRRPRLKPGGMVKRSLSIILALALATLVVQHTGNGATTETSAILFRDVTQTSGIRFVHNNGAFGKKFLPETMGPGVAFIDYDNDGWPDIFLVNGTDWPSHVQKHSTPKLYHNNHDGTFTDVTHKAGLDVEMFGMGVAVGDYDNDGYDDLFVTAYGQSHLFHNNGNGTFTDVTQKAGLLGPQEFITSPAWVDYHNDRPLGLADRNHFHRSPAAD